MLCTTKSNRLTRIASWPYRWVKIRNLSAVWTRVGLGGWPFWPGLTLQQFTQTVFFQQAQGSGDRFGHSFAVQAIQQKKIPGKELSQWYRSSDLEPVLFRRKKMHAKSGKLKDFVCRKCGLYGMIDVVRGEYEYDPATGILYDVLEDGEKIARGDQIICDCGGQFFDMQSRGEEDL